MFLNQNGELLGMVGQKEVHYPAKKLFFFLPVPAYSSWETARANETVMEAVQRVGISVQYVVVFFNGELVLYKPPKKFPTVGAWMEEQIRRAQEKIKGQLAMIEGEG